MINGSGHGCFGPRTHEHITEDDMATKIVDKMLPTTMVGSYPRPSWYTHQLLGRDIRVAFK